MRSSATATGLRARLHAWVDLHDPDPNLDPVDLGQLVAGLHRVDFAGAIGVDPWYTEPVGAERWFELVCALRARHAPFADELDALRPELVAMEAYLGGPPRELRTCHRDLWADNLRRTPDGSLCVFDFDNAGLADPSQELAGSSSSTARIRRAPVSSAPRTRRRAGRARRGPTDFAMVIAQLSHILARAAGAGWPPRATPNAPTTRAGSASSSTGR